MNKWLNFGRDRVTLLGDMESGSRTFIHTDSPDGGIGKTCLNWRRYALFQCFYSLECIVWVIEILKAPTYVRMLLGSAALNLKTVDPSNILTYVYKNSSGDEIANVNFYAVRPEATRIRWNNAKQRHYAVQGHSVTDFGTNRKLIYNFLLVINTLTYLQLVPFPRYSRR